MWGAIGSDSCKDPLFSSSIFLASSMEVVGVKLRSASSLYASLVGSGYIGGGETAAMFLNLDFLGFWCS